MARDKCISRKKLQGGEKVKVYIGGKITGDEYYREKFNVFSEIEQKRGNVVLNPAMLPSGMTQADYMRICFAMLDCADQACFLPDYEQSEGAMLEVAYCKKTGKPWSVYAMGHSPNVG